MIGYVLGLCPSYEQSFEMNSEQQKVPKVDLSIKNASASGDFTTASGDFTVASGDDYTAASLDTGPQIGMLIPSEAPC